MSFECDKSTIVFRIELDALDRLAARSFTIRKVDLEHVGREMLVEFDLASVVACYVLWFRNVRGGRRFVVHQRLDHDLGRQKHGLNARVVLQQERLSFVFRFYSLEI